MEITAFNIYLFGLLLELRDFFENITVFSIIIAAVVLFLMPIWCDFESITKYNKRIFLIFLIVLAISLIGKLLSPSKEITTAMFVVPPVVNNEKIQELPENVLDFVNGWLKENTIKKDNKKSF